MPSNVIQRLAVKAFYLASGISLVAFTVYLFFPWSS